MFSFLKLNYYAINDAHLIKHVPILSITFQKNIEKKILMQSVNWRNIQLHFPPSLFTWSVVLENKPTG